MPRTSTPWFITPATFGRCSEIWMSGAAVLIGLNSPAPLLSGLRSNVSLCDGPPSIHSRMHDLVFLPDSAALASTGSQPDRPAPKTPAAVSFRKSRRVFSVRRSEDMAAPCQGGVYWGVGRQAHPSRRVGLRRGLPHQRELAAVEHRPQDVAVGGRGGAVLAQVLGEHLRLRRRRPAA